MDGADAAAGGGGGGRVLGGENRAARGGARGGGAVAERENQADLQDEDERDGAPEFSGRPAARVERGGVQGGCRRSQGEFHFRTPPTTGGRVASSRSCTPAPRAS